MSTTQATQTTIRDYRESDLHFVISEQYALFKAEYGLDSPIWTSYLHESINSFVGEFDADRDCFYIAEQDGQPVGSIAIVHRESGTAQLRFFFLKRTARGSGAGKKLLESALAFCRDAGYAEVFLWTFSTLYAARNLYAKSGFTLTETQANNDWGTPVTEERWDLTLRSDV